MNIIKEIIEAKRECQRMGLEFDLSDVSDIIYNRVWDIVQYFNIRFGHKRYCHSYYWNLDGFVVIHPMNKTEWFVWRDEHNHYCYGIYNPFAERKAKAMKERGSK